MTARGPSRLALAILDFFVPDTAPLKGDLLEEFEARRSQGWLWRQVIGAAVRQPAASWLPGELHLPLVGTALLVLVSFEVVLVTNVMFRLLFGPPLLIGALIQEGGHAASGYFYLLQRELPATESVDVMPLGVWIRASVPAFVVSLPVGWWLAGRLNGHGQGASMAVILVGLVLCAVLNLQLPFAAQFLSTLTLTTGFLAGGRLAVITTERRAGGL
jgi:hypothetical protein